ncbi:lipopolysaccharide heptosyltransferase I [Ramlibacter sp. MAHUQ-53]|uniref:lipopolysaccharide heptosyltransferase I n=1 Tax=unclassified Ramlibacter TaxID=2617605 RepID=UPI00362D60C8
MRVLIVKLSSLGDVVQTLPVLHDIQGQFPQARIDWVVEEAFAPLVRRAARVDRVLPIAQRRWRKARFDPVHRQERRAFFEALRAQAYDAVIDCQGLLKSALVARRARLAPGGFSATFGNASELCGYEWPVRWLLQRPLPMPARIHAVARTRLLVAQALGYAGLGVLEQPPTYPWRRRAPAGVPQVLLAHGTTRADNEWPAAHWAEIGRRLTAQGCEVQLPQASDAEGALADRIAREIGASARVLPRMGLPALLEHMEGLSGLVGVDSGVAHMGVALDLPVVEIFSQPRAWRAGPVGRPHQCAVGGERAPSPDEVWNAWQACWQARPDVEAG